MAALAVTAAPAAAQLPVPARPQTTSLDSEAPPGAPPHWLPAEEWVMQHWLPYDERRLYTLLGIDRGDVWQQLRDDTHNLAELARQRGWEPETLATALVEPWRGRLEDPKRLALLERRALRTLTQGHLAQHIFFHSLHQEAIPRNAPAIFGVASRSEWSVLRRSELSPLQICRLNGLPRGHLQEQATATLTAAAERGVHGEAIPPAQAKRLLSRQLRQLPRWMQQTRYNGPPPLVSPRSSPATASNYSNNAALSRDGGEVVFEAYEAKLTVAKTRGEIAVMARLGAAAPVLASGRRGDPRSNYNPVLSANGRWVAFESAEGNLNFAKRYGQMQVWARDLARGRIVPVSHPPDLAVARSAYNPTVSGDGRLVGYESYERPEDSAGQTRVLVSDLRTGRTRAVARPAGAASDLYEPRLSADGRFLAFTALSPGARSEVFLRDLRANRTTRASRPLEEAWEPALSADGRTVAYTAAQPGGGSRVVVRGPASRTVVGSPAGSGVAYEPSLSDDGTRVAFVARPAGTRSTQVFVRDLRAGVTELASRADGRHGAPAQGTATHPAISGDGRKVAFTSDAWNLTPGKCNSARGVFVRDLARDTTAQASVGDGGNRYVGPTKGSSTGSDAFTALLCA